MQIWSALLPGHHSTEAIRSCFCSPSLIHIGITVNRLNGENSEFIMNSAKRFETEFKMRHFIYGQHYAMLNCGYLIQQAKCRMHFQSKYAPNRRQWNRNGTSFRGLYFCTSMDDIEFSPYTRQQQIAFLQLLDWFT